MAKVYGTSNPDVLDQADGVTNASDVVYGLGGPDTIYGLGGTDSLHGGSGNDTLHGGSDDDWLSGGAGADTLHGGSGDDTASYTGSDEGVAVSLLGGTGSHGDADGDALTAIENLAGSGYADDLLGNADSNVLDGQGGNDTLKGFGGVDTLHGGDDDDTLWGGDSNDTLHGESGNDWLHGGAGIDAMAGGLGDDTYIVDDFNDTVSELNNQGADVVLTSTSWYMTAAYVETLRTTDDHGTTSITLMGNGISNTIIGNDGHNILDGNYGADHLVGRGGNDIYHVDNVGDSLVESAGQGIDTVRVAMSWTLPVGADVENLWTFFEASMDPINLTGNGSGNAIRGNAGNNILGGGDGNDELTGLGGADSFLFDTPLDAAFNVDEITDFNVADDTIVLENTIFGAFSAGDLAAERFVVGATAQDASDNILYNDVTGALLYDSDGSGAAAAVQFAQLSPGFALTHLDFIVV